MSRTPLPSTPLPGTPALRVPSPARTPSPLPLLSGAGPYLYSGLISRKYASRFNQIKATKDKVRNAEEAWEKEAKERGTDAEGLAKSMETNYDWEEKTLDTVTHVKPQGEIVVQAEQGEAEGGEEGGKDVQCYEKERGKDREEEVVEKRLSLEDDQFVDALQSPMRDKPRDWDDVMSDHEV
jgi:hypothetical protein